MFDRNILSKVAVTVFVLTMAVVFLSTRGSAQQKPSESEKAAAKAAWPKDVNRDSGYRLPLPRREDMGDEEGKKVYDQVTGNGPGLIGPFAVQMYSPKYQAILRQLNQFLRSEASGLTPHVQEVSVLVACRESNADFEWTAHETLAQKAGVDQKVIDAIKNRKPSAGLPNEDAAIIDLGREIYRQKKVDSETFARANKLYGPTKLVNIVGLMGFYSTAAAELQTFGFEMPAGEKSTLPAAGR
jgi:4-carboxymuconolactone decarboxylase